MVVLNDIKYGLLHTLSEMNDVLDVGKDERFAFIGMLFVYLKLHIFKSLFFLSK